MLTGFLALAAFVAGCFITILVVIHFGKKELKKKHDAMVSLMNKPQVHGPNSVLDAQENIVIKLN